MIDAGPLGVRRDLLHDADDFIPALIITKIAHPFPEWILLGKLFRKRAIDDHDGTLAVKVAGLEGTACQKRSLEHIKVSLVDVIRCYSERHLPGNIRFNLSDIFVDTVGRTRYSRTRDTEPCL